MVEVELKQKKLWSAGGVVVRSASGNQYDVVVCERQAEGLVALPKGSPTANETRSETALREVGEETGLLTSILGELGSINYFFVKQDDNQLSDVTLYDKTVYFYLMAADSGSFDKHDNEYDKVFWLNMSDSWKQLTYPAEVEIVRRAFELLKTQAPV